MKIILRLFFYVLFSAFALAAVLLLVSWLTLKVLLQESPEVSQFESSSLADIQRIKSLAVDFSRQIDQSENKKITLGERDINLAIGHFAPLQLTLPEQTFFKVELDESSRATLTATAPAELIAENIYRQYKTQIPSLLMPVVQWLKGTTADQWLNIRWHAVIDPDAQQQQWLRSDAIGIGKINLNKTLSNAITDNIYSQLIARPETRLARESWKNLRGLAIIDRALHVEFMLPAQGLSALSSYQSLVLSPGEQQLIGIYEQKLGTLPQRGPLVKVLAPLFQLASQRTNETDNPVAENRAVLLALSKKYGGDQLLSMLQTSQGTNFSAAPKPYTVFGRRDLAQHLILSAGLSLIANQNLAELIGIDKEMSDLMGGRTISAWDLLADKAGVRLAENATLSAKSARDIQLWFRKARRDSDVMPDLAAEFEFSEDRYSANELAQLELMIELYLEQHRALQKQI